MVGTLSEAREKEDAAQKGDAARSATEVAAT
jgi:hypothetical protein